MWVKEGVATKEGKGTDLLEPSCTGVTGSTVRCPPRNGQDVKEEARRWPGAQEVKKVFKIQIEEVDVAAQSQNLRGGFPKT